MRIVFACGLEREEEKAGDSLPVGGSSDAVGESRESISLVARGANDEGPLTKVEVEKSPLMVSEASNQDVGVG